MTDSLGNRLKDLRTTARMTQRDVAAYMRERYGWTWSQTNVSRLEGGREPLLKELQAFADLFGITLDELVHGPFDHEYESPVGGYVESSDFQLGQAFWEGEARALAAEEAFHVQRLVEIRSRREELRAPYGTSAHLDDEGK